MCSFKYIDMIEELRFYFLYLIKKKSKYDLIYGMNFNFKGIWGFILVLWF